MNYHIELENSQGSTTYQISGNSLNEMIDRLISDVSSRGLYDQKINIFAENDDGEPAAIDSEVEKLAKSTITFALENEYEEHLRNLRQNDCSDEEYYGITDRVNAKSFF